MASVFIPIDRPAAAVRGLWRLLAAAIPGGMAAFLVSRMDWEQYWRDQRLVGLCWAFILTIVAFMALGLAVSAIRWLIAAATPRLGVELNERELVVRAGPFGSNQVDLRRLQLKLDGDLSLLDWSQLPEDIVGVSVFHPSTRGDLLEHLRPLLGHRRADFVRALREHVSPAAQQDD